MPSLLRSDPDNPSVYEGKTKMSIEDNMQLISFLIPQKITRLDNPASFTIFVISFSNFPVPTNTA